MSFIIKGLDFPKTCGDCPCCVEYDNGVCIYSDNYYTGMFCSALDCTSDIYEIDQKLNNCPLVEIPAPHGRLIDADEIEKCMHEWYDVGEYVFADTIRNADTIIEAEE